MAHSAGFKKVQSGVEDELARMISRGRSVSAVLDRVVWPKYQQAQIERWESENSSQGARWEPLSRPYAKRKPVLYAAYPGGGHALMVATSRLSQGAQGRDTAYFGRLITDQKFEVTINTSALPYAVYPGEKRPFMRFSDGTIQEWTQDVAEYVMRGKL